MILSGALLSLPFCRGVAQSDFLQDNLEWGSGYEMHFGVVWIERPSLERIPKDSLRYYSEVIQTAAKKAGRKQI